MVKNQQKSESSVAEYIKIRQYIINLLTKSGTEQKMIPSTRELEKFFGVSRPTVIKALRDLVADGYLIAKPGIGTFTNPQQSLSSLHGMKKIGLIMGDGKVALYDHFLWKIMSCCGEKLLGAYQDCCIQPCNLIEGTQNLVQEIRNLELSGLIWVLPPDKYHDQIKELRLKHGLPLVVMDQVVDSVSSIVPDFEKEGYEIAKKMLAGKQKNIVFLHQKNNRMSEALPGIHRAYEELGLKYNAHLAMEGNENSLNELNRMIELGLEISGVIAFVMAGRVLQLLRSKNIGNTCITAAHEWAISRDMDFKGIIIRNHFDKAAEVLADELVLLMKNPARKAMLLKIDFDLELKYE